MYYVRTYICVYLLCMYVLRTYGRMYTCKHISIYVCKCNNKTSLSINNLKPHTHTHTHTLIHTKYQTVKQAA